MCAFQKSKKKDVSEEENDVKEFYANKKDHKVSSLKKLTDELDS